jgi:hypothetical protein
MPTKLDHLEPVSELQAREIELRICGSLSPKAVNFNGPGNDWTLGTLAYYIHQKRLGAHPPYRAVLETAEAALRAIRKGQ